MDALQGHHPLGHHLVQPRQDGRDVLLGVNHFDDQRQVLAELEQSRGVQPGTGAETLHPAPPAEDVTHVGRPRYEITWTRSRVIIPSDTISSTPGRADGAWFPVADTSIA